ncbi:MAG: hypothetical protein ACI9WU_003969 [Myxococcota bacterium]|jgi:hypothetical protein
MRIIIPLVLVAAGVAGFLYYNTLQPEGTAGPETQTAAVLPPAGQVVAVPTAYKPARKTASETLKAEERPELKVSATGVQPERDALWVRALVPGSERGELRTYRVLGSRYGVAGRDGDRLFVRLTGLERPASITVEERSRPEWLRQGEIPALGLRTITIDLAGVAISPEEEGRPEDQGLSRAGWRALERDLNRRSDRGTAPWHTFAANRMSLLGGGTARGNNRARRARRSEIGDLMALYTGMTSVEEALQTDRALRIRAEAADQRTIDPATIPGVPLAAHPWDEMMEKLGKKPVMEDIAKRVPADMLYLHFTDLRTAAHLGDEVEEWVTPLARLLEWRPGNAFLAERYQRQLILERTELSKNFGHFAAGSVAFLAGDPFLREGAPVAILFAVRNEALLNQSLGRFEKKARAANPDMAEEQYTVDGVAFRRLYTPDGRVNQHRGQLDGVLMLTNSRATAKQLVEVAKGRAPSLASSGDFQYMRSLYPHTPEEDGFVFLSDAFVASAVSPRNRILQARRMEAQADLAAVGYAALLHGWLEGKPGPDVATLLASGMLSEEELMHADGAKIALDPVRGAWSEAWGRPFALRPLADLDLGMVSDQEKRAYERFREGYQRNWSTFIDPVAVQITRSDDGKALSIDGRILPLIEATDYDELVTMVGKAQITPPQLDGAFAWTFAVGREAKVRRELERVARWITSGPVNFNWLGDWVTMGARDEAALFELLMLTGVRPRKAGSERIRDRDVIARLNEAPLYMAVHIDNPLGLGLMLTAVRALAEGAAPGIITWHKAEKHRKVDVVRVEVNAGQATGGEMPTFSLYYSIVKNVLVLALQPATLAWQIDAVLDGKGTKVAAADSGQPQTHLGLSLIQSDGGLTRSALSLLEVEAIRQARAAHRDAEVLLRGLGQIPTGLDGAGWLGHVPSPVQGGGFDVRHGELVHGIYGTELAPNVPGIPVANGSITRLLEGLKAASGSLSFEGEGISRGLRMRVSRQLR